MPTEQSAAGELVPPVYGTFWQRAGAGAFDAMLSQVLFLLAIYGLRPSAAQAWLSVLDTPIAWIYEVGNRTQQPLAYAFLLARAGRMDEAVAVLNRATEQFVAPSAAAQLHALLRGAQVATGV